MKAMHAAFFQPLGAVGLGLALATAGCGASGGDESTGTATDNTTGTTGGASTGATDASSAPTSEVTTGTTEATVAPTSGAASDDTGPPASSTGETSTDGTSSASASSTGGVEASLSFFVSSTGSLTANLGGLAGADQRCQDLAEAVGAGAKTWRAYLSVEHGPDDQPVHAKDRIGAGPWFNAELVMLAADVADLHTKEGDHTLFLDENGDMVPGQWEGSPAPNQHDILTGSNKDGTLLPGKTCADWTSEDAALFAQVGHSDGLGPMMNDAEQYRSWNSVHENGGCNDTAPKGGAGRIYCFAID